jgi:hypothetical protein
MLLDPASSSGFYEYCKVYTLVCCGDVVAEEFVPFVDAEGRNDRPDRSHGCWNLDLKKTKRTGVAKRTTTCHAVCTLLMCGQCVIAYLRRNSGDWRSCGLARGLGDWRSTDDDVQNGGGVHSTPGSTARLLRRSTRECLKRDGSRAEVDPDAVGRKSSL